MNDLILEGGLVLTPDGPVTADVFVRDGIVAGLGESLGSDEATVLDCRGAWVGPGFVDVHTHLREPGEEWKEDIGSGSEAAAAGGYTAVLAMPNTDPPIDAGHLARYVADRGSEVGLVTVIPAGCVTAGRAGERLSHLDELWMAGVRVFTDDGDSVADAGLLRRAMDYLAQLGGIVAQHAIDAGLARGGHMHEGDVSSRLGMAAIPAEAESTVVARDLALVRLTGCRYHIQHVSASQTVALIAAAKAEGLPVTAEVTPHHLAFDHRVVESTDPVFKMMPPLRSPEDREALVVALRDGVIDMVATDHAPHADHEKDVPFEHAPHGVIGLEWAGAVVNTQVGLEPVAFYERLSIAPAALLGASGQGRWIEPGAPATMTVFDPEADALDHARSRSRNTPHLGRGLRGRARHTLLQGTLTHSATIVPHPS